MMEKIRDVVGTSYRFGDREKVSALLEDDNFLAPNQAEVKCCVNNYISANWLIALEEALYGGRYHQFVSKMLLQI